MKKTDKRTNNSWFYILFISMPLLSLIFLLYCERIIKVVDFNVSEWVSLIVGYLTYFGTIILAFVTVSQNSVISVLTKKQYELQKLSLTVDRRPLLSITNFSIFQQDSEKGVFVGFNIPLTEKPYENPDPLSKHKYYIGEIDYSLFDFFHNCDNPGQIRFRIGITNRSKDLIHNMSFNTYFSYHDKNNRNSAVPTKLVIDVVEPGVNLCMDGVTIVKSNEFESCSYHFHIIFSNDYDRHFFDNIGVFFFRFADTGKLRVTVQHDMKDETYQTHCEPLDDYEMIMNGLLDLKGPNYEERIKHFHITM